MSDAPLRWAIGLMSGTRMDGIDAALILSNGRDHVEFGTTITKPYDDAFRERLVYRFRNSYPRISESKGH